MGVIINEFEVGAPQPADTPAAGATRGGGEESMQQSGGVPPPIGPLDIMDVMRHYAERKLRVRAH